MIFLLVTHADPNYGASGILSDKGRQGTREWLAKESIEYLPENTVVVGILSSPRTRCIETATILAGELGRVFAARKLKGYKRVHGKPWDDIPATRIDVLEELDEQPVAFSAESLQSAIITGRKIAKPQIEKLEKEKRDYIPVVIVAVHGDLANALSMRESQFASWDEKKAGWFFDRKPVLAILNDSLGHSISGFEFRGPITTASMFPEDNAKRDPICLGHFDIVEAS